MRLIKWGLHWISHEPGKPLSSRAYVRPPLGVYLDWGPQHVDLEVQDVMRGCYFGRPQTWGQVFDAYSRTLERREQVLFWCEPVLPGALAILWALETLAARGANLRNAYLVVAPGRSDIERNSPEAVEQAIGQRLPVIEVLPTLLRVRRHLASDSSEVKADLSDLPDPVRNWAGVTDRLEEFLPDERGLDVLDSLILDQLSEQTRRGREWQRLA